MDDRLLIEQVSLFPLLYAKTDPIYKNIRLEENAWKTIGAVLEETPQACEHRWKVLRNKYTAVKRELKSTPSGSGATEIITWPYYDMMQFIDPFLQTRKSFSNLSVNKRPQSNEWDTMSSIIMEDSENESSQGNIMEAEGPEDSSVNDTPKIQRKRIAASIPRQTLPAKRAKPDTLADKMTGCFDTFQKVLENQHQNDAKEDNDNQFVKSLVSDLRIYSQKQKMLIKREIYNVLANHI